MTTLYVSHNDCLDHDTTDNHPEHPDRLRAINEALSAPDFDGLERMDAPLATEDMLLLVHPQAHLDMINRAARS